MNNGKCELGSEKKKPKRKTTAARIPVLQVGHTEGRRFRLFRYFIFEGELSALGKLQLIIRKI